MEEDHGENLKFKAKELDGCKVHEIVIQTKKLKCCMNQVEQPANLPLSYHFISKR